MGILPKPCPRKSAAKKEECIESTRLLAERRSSEAKVGWGPIANLRRRDRWWASESLGHYPFYCPFLKVLRFLRQCAQGPRPKQVTCPFFWSWRRTRPNDSPALRNRRGRSLRADCVENLRGSHSNVLQAIRQKHCITFVELNVVLRR